MENTKIEPALTAEEWVLRLSGNYSGPSEAGVSVMAGGELAITYDGGMAVAGVDDPHACAALALHDQPFGFSRDMVRALRTILERHVDTDRGPPGAGWQSEELLQMIGFAETAIDRIEALLPPE